MVRRISSDPEIQLFALRSSRFDFVRPADGLTRRRFGAVGHKDGVHAPVCFDQSFTGRPRTGRLQGILLKIIRLRKGDALICVMLRQRLATFIERVARLTVTRDSMLPQDTLARYGGEEFVIPLPDTGLDEAIDAMARLQRALTRRFFLAGGEKILITFSAGVAPLATGESGQDAIKRAGKNRVMGA